MKSPASPHTASYTVSETDAMEEMLNKPIAPTSPIPSRAEGIIIGHFEALDEDGTPTVRIDTWGLHELKAGTLVALDASHIGQTVALGFESADPYHPIILGFMMASKPQVPSNPVEARLDQKRVVLNAEQEIELRCGDAAIILNADGRVMIRGSYITSQASATQRILGGSVSLN
ncbi:MAG: hypothetical protein KZQ89_20875 [Candidatus Thiodiazotropha sp. (ex Lucinoma kastoroae)]|nr:hypothetical protein [Candidatus Thiodiazotropha sp. (ex Lucinoma kastoroae)]